MQPHDPPSTSVQPRVQPGGFAELGPVNWLLCRVLARAVGLKDVRLFSTLGRRGGLFRGWLHFSGRLMPGGVLSRHETELVILRVAHLRGCDYERDHHVRIGRRVGVDARVLAQIEAGPADPAWDERARALLAAVDELIARKDLGDAAWAALARHYSEPQRIELCMLVGNYEMLATTIAALRIARDF